MTALLSGAVHLCSQESAAPPAGDSRFPDGFEEAAAAYETAGEAREQWHRRSLDLLYEEYQSATVEQTAQSEYEAALDAVLAQIMGRRETVEQAIGDAGRDIFSLLQSSPPTAGTPAASALFEWAASHVRNAPRRTEMVLLLLGAEIDEFSTDERQLLAVQLLILPDDEVRPFLSSLGEMLEEFGAVGLGLSRELEQLQLASRVEARLGGDSLSADEIAALRPWLSAEREPADPRWQDQARSLGSTLSLFAESSPELLHLRAAADPTVMFALERADSLMLRASARERARFARRTGLSGGKLAELHQRIYAARSHVEREGLLLRLQDLREEQPSRYGSSFLPSASDQSESGVRFYDEYRELGEENAALVAQLASSSDPHSGDDYRWTMLGALSHPYALHLLATDERYLAAAGLMDEFVSGIYAETAERAGVPAPPAGVNRYDRTVIETERAAVQNLYAAFVQSAQGLEELPQSYAQEYAPGITQAEHWAHIHGFHVVVEEATSSLLVERASRWFELALIAEIPDERFAHQLRGLSALHDEVARIRETVSSSRAVSLASFAARLSAASAWAELAVAFRVDSATATDVTRRLFGWHSREQIGESLSRQERQVSLAFRIVELMEMEEQ